jgi:hypothetical protein
MAACSSPVTVPKATCDPNWETDSIAVLFWGYRPNDTFQVMGYAHGIPNGACRIYNEDGSLETLGNLRCGQMDGKYEKFYMLIGNFASNDFYMAQW